MDITAYQAAKSRVMDAQRVRAGIGTLSEKTVHAVLKYYFEPDETRHEVKVGRYFADIAAPSGIIEIQTRGFNALRPKLEAFLAAGPVTLVHPVPYVKYLRWMDTRTGEASPPRKSPRRGAPWDVLTELYKIKGFLRHENLTLCVVLLNVEEYRLLNGWSADGKKGSCRYDRIPQELVAEVWVRRAEDYQKLIPPALEGPFTVKDFKKYSGMSRKAAGTAVNVLHDMGAVRRTGKLGNAYLYEREQGG